MCGQDTFQRVFQTKVFNYQYPLWAQVFSTNGSNGAEPAPVTVISEIVY